MLSTVLDVFRVRQYFNLATRLNEVVARPDLHVASQVRTSQQIELARANLRALEQAMPTVMIEPVPYEKVQGVGFYRQFLRNREWPQFMADGRAHTLRALHRLAGEVEEHSPTTA